MYSFLLAQQSQLYQEKQHNTAHCTTPTTKNTIHFSSEMQTTIYLYSIFAYAGKQCQGIIIFDG